MAPATLIITGMYFNHNKWDRFLARQAKITSSFAKTTAEVYERDAWLCVAHLPTDRLCTVRTRRLHSELGASASDLVSGAEGEVDEAEEEEEMDEPLGDGEVEEDSDEEE